jgi:hypothetical protein
MKPPQQKPIGSYLVDAGLLTASQVEVILADQQSNGLLFGEIASARGWIKQKTVDFFMEKVVTPERGVSVSVSDPQSSADIFLPNSQEEASHFMNRRQNLL